MRQKSEWWEEWERRGGGGKERSKERDQEGERKRNGRGKKKERNRLASRACASRRRDKELMTPEIEGEHLRS